MTVTATATAEAYNPSNSQTNTGNYVPIAPKCVKPLLIPNNDPGHPGNPPFVSATTGTVTLPGIYPGGVIGETFGPPGSIPPLSDACPNGSATCNSPSWPPQATQAGYYLPAAVTPNTANLCPSCTGSDDFEQSIECCDFNVYSCGGTPPTTVATTGGPIPTSADTTMGGNTSRQDARNGVQCLIHQPQEDTLDTANFLSNTGPMQMTARSGPLSGKLVTTSSSIATLPIFNTDPASFNPATGQVTVVGFLQVFIVDVIGNGDTTVTILNVAGCGNNPSSAPAVSGGGVSPIPVRLIHQ